MHSVTKKTLTDVCPNWMSDGIFHHLTNVPWSRDASTLDIEYYGNHSGSKRISPLVRRIMGTSETLSETNLDTLASIAMASYGTKWAKLYATLSLEYNPIQNYDMTETETGSGTENETTNEDKSHSSSSNRSNQNVRTDDLTDGENTTVMESSDLTQNIYGANSTTPVPSERSDTSRNGSNYRNRTQTGTVTDAYSGTDSESGSEDNQIIRDKDTTNSRTLRRSGNIGVTTSQQMIEAERSLWFWNFWQVVFADMDQLLALRIY